MLKRVSVEIEEVGRSQFAGDLARCQFGYNDRIVLRAGSVDGHHLFLSAFRDFLERLVVQGLRPADQNVEDGLVIFRGLRHVISVEIGDNQAGFFRDRNPGKDVDVRLLPGKIDVDLPCRCLCKGVRAAVGVQAF